MTSKLVLPFIALAALPVAAQPVEHPADVAPVPADVAPAGRLELAVDIAATPELDPDVVRAALAAELGVTIVDADAFAPALGRLAIEVGPGVVRIAYQPASGPRIARELALPAAQTDRVELIGFVATNLVRDQVTALLASLPPPPPPAPGTVVIRAPAGVRAVVRASAQPRMIPATIGLIPPLAVDRIAGSDVSVGLGIHAIMGMTDSSRIASISGVADVQRHSVYGVQIGGAAAIAGSDVQGIQIGGAATVTRRLRGAQIAGAVAVADHVDGLQIGGAIDVANRVHGMQIAGAVNIANDVDGAQIGVINVARHMHGLQLGVINVSDDGDDAYPIGLLNFARNGRVEVDGWVESSQLSAVALRHGPKHIHNLVALGWTPDHDHLLAGFGLGFHRAVSRGAHPITLDVDAVNWWTNLWAGDTGQLEQLRLTVAVPVGAIDVIGGVAGNVYITDEMDESENFHPYMARRVTSDTGVRVVSWPSVFAGVRLHAY